MAVQEKPQIRLDNLYFNDKIKKSLFDNSSAGF